MSSQDRMTDSERAFADDVLEKPVSANRALLINVARRLSAELDAVAAELHAVTEDRDALLAASPAVEQDGWRARLSIDKTAKSIAANFGYEFSDEDEAYPRAYWRDVARHALAAAAGVDPCVHPDGHDGDCVPPAPLVPVPVEQGDGGRALAMSEVDGAAAVEPGDWVIVSPEWQEVSKVQPSDHIRGSHVLFFKDGGTFRVGPLDPVVVSRAAPTDPVPAVQQEADGRSFSAGWTLNLAAGERSPEALRVGGWRVVPQEDGSIVLTPPASVESNKEG